MVLAWGVSETEAVMAEERPTPKSVLGLVGSYALAFALLVLGSVVGGAVAISIAAFAYGAVTSGEGVQDMVNVLALQGGLGMLGLAEGEYSTSAASAIYTMAFYLSFIGIWIVFLIYLRASKRVRPILGAVTRRTAGNTPARLGLGLLLGFVLNGACVLVAVLEGSFSLSLVGVNVAGIIAVFLAVFVQSSAEEFVCRCYLYERTFRVTGSHVFAIALSTVFFTLLHLANSGLTALALVNLALCGVLFGLAVWKLDSPWMAFGLHASWNFTQAVLFGLPNSGGTTPFAIFGVTPGTTPVARFAYDPGFGIEGSAMAAIVLVAGCALVWWLGERWGARPTDLWADAGADGPDGAGGPDGLGVPAAAPNPSAPTAENIAIF